MLDACLNILWGMLDEQILRRIWRRSQPRNQALVCRQHRICYCCLNIGAQLIIRDHPLGLGRPNLLQVAIEHLKFLKHGLRWETRKPRASGLQHRHHLRPRPALVLHTPPAHSAQHLLHPVIAE
uniref:Uncharacterized protein n=1 Tax=Triticum urartu TaxID=4572 RepID=A0A8R7RAH0_TRIUA